MSRLLNLEDGNILIDADEQEKLSSPAACGYKLVPWLNWDEWEWVKVSIFSDSPDKIESAINRISTWRSRGCLPVVVDVTASLVEIQLKDQFFRRKDLPCDALHSEQMLAMLYSMAILRLVNCVVEKTRKKTEISIAEAAAAIGIPRTLIDIRHESSHRDLPSLTLVRDSAVKAIHWLKAYYWEPQMELIPHQRNGSGEIRKEIKSKLRQLASSLSEVQDSQHEASPVEGKSKKKQKTKILKSLVRLYSSFSSEVLSVLLNFLLKSLDSSNLLEFAEDYQVGQDVHSALDDWKIVITKLSKKEPELLLMLLRAILSTIETEEAIRCETGMYFLAKESRPENGNIGKLSSLFTWLVRQLKLLKPLQKKDSKARAEVSASEMNKLRTVLKELLRKCLVISLGGNKQLMESALQLAQRIGDGSLIEKISKLKLLDLSNSDASEENDFLKSCSALLVQQDEVIRQAAEKLESVKLLLAKRRNAKATDVSSNTGGRWSVVKSWNPCPIGTLPRDLGSSGCLPVLDINDNGNKKSADSSERAQICEDAKELSSDIYHNNIDRKREASSDVVLLEKQHVKRMKETVENCESDSEDCLLQTEFKGCLMINGVWKKVSEEELDSIKSCVRILN